jgi:hypothetical protein
METVTPSSSWSAKHIDTKRSYGHLVRAAVRDAVRHARERGYSWAFIGSLVGTSGEAARQRYGHKQDA